MSKDKKPKRTLFNNNAMREMMEHFGNLDKERPEPGYTRSIKLTAERPDEVLKVTQKTIPKKLFEMKPFYDVDDPFKFSAPLDEQALLKNLKDYVRYKEVLNTYLTSNNKKIKEGKYLILKSESSDLKKEITLLISKIDELDREAIEYFRYTLEKTLKQIENRDRAHDFKKEMRWFFTIGIRQTTLSNVQKHCLKHIFKFDEMPDEAKENTRNALRMLFDEKQPLINKLQPKVERYQIYQRAIEHHKEGKRIIPEGKQGAPVKDPIIKSKAIKYLKDNISNLRGKTRKEIKDLLIKEIPELKKSMENKDNGYKYSSPDNWIRKEVPGFN